ncbi:pentapeptide repeat-containing protein [Butyrivibrio sp. NC3005]|jgi:hypothetical protein|uniref:pentapeptide repeat-containing protein n=1 Tax=Butyrivibrio sp. NC3005 TaxID=1280685 RepID=UPI00040D6FA8|nr:hypothetical protein [Butyrivibrio sp. NC3005]
MDNGTINSPLKKGYIMIRESYQREGETYADLSEYCQEDMFIYSRLKECFLYEYNGSPCRLFEVEVIDEIEKDSDSRKDRYYTNKVRIIHEIPRERLLNELNVGLNCNGFLNSGDDNIGDSNSGYGNLGSKNSGSFNIGEKNAGSFNSGNNNVGEGNVGHFNSGEHNQGNNNAGCYNNGDFNAGDFNAGNYNSGSFCTGETPFMLFNQPSPITREEWMNSDARNILMLMPKKSTKWNNDIGCAEKEYQQSPAFGMNDGNNEISVPSYDKFPRQEWWDKLPEEKKQIIYDIPGFDIEIFEQCTGILVSGND